MGTPREAPLLRAHPRAPQPMRRGLGGGPLQRPGRGGPSREHGRADARVKVTSCVSPRTCLQTCPDYMETERLQAAGRFSLTPHAAPSSCRRAPTTCPAPPRTTATGVQPAEPTGRARDPRSLPSPPGGPGSSHTAGPPPREPPVSGLPGTKPGPSQRQLRGPSHHRGWRGRTHAGRPQSAGGCEEIMVFSSCFCQMLCLLLTLKQIS